MQTRHVLGSRPFLALLGQGLVASWANMSGGEAAEGHMAAPGAGPGAVTITELLAKYSEQMMMRRRYGEDHLGRRVGVDLQRYLHGDAGKW